jgi:hypothetical protein
VAGTTRELLVLLDPDRTDAALVGLRAVAAVTQTLRPRLALVAAQPGQRDALTAVPGVLGVYTLAAPDAVLDTLDDTERMFAVAWSIRDPDTRRSGDHQPWDSPGRLPPDLPPATRRG